LPRRALRGKAGQGRAAPPYRFAYAPLFTILGSAAWCSVLCDLGVKMGQDERLMKGELHRITICVGAVVVLGGLYYFFVHRPMKAENEST
jgi:membrane protein DedA with SNARE-associated domain